MQNNLIDNSASVNTTLIFGKPHSGKTYLTLQMLKNLKRYIVVDQFDEYSGFVVSNEIEALNYARQNPKDFKICIRLQEERPNLFNVLYCITNYTLIVEELSMHCTCYIAPKFLKYIMAFGRRRKINFIGISQRPAQVNTSIRGCANTIITFNMQEPNDIKYLSFWGFDSTTLNSLKQYQHLSKEF